MEDKAILCLYENPALHQAQTELLVICDVNKRNTHKFYNEEITIPPRIRKKSSKLPQFSTPMTPTGKPLNESACYKHIKSAHVPVKQAKKYIDNFQDTD